MNNLKLIHTNIKAYANRLTSLHDWLLRKLTFTGIRDK